MKKTIEAGVLLLLASHLALSSAQSIDTLLLDTQLGPPGGYGFGKASKVDWNRAYVGQPALVTGVATPGGVHVFQPSANLWNLEALLTSSAAIVDDRFGSAVAADNFRLLVGAPGESNPLQEAGAAYVFERPVGPWVEAARLLSPSPTMLAQFGWAVAINGDYALVSAPAGDGAAVASGAAYVFHRSGGIFGTWTLQQTLTASDGRTGDRFGWSVSLLGQFAAIGAPNAQGQGAASGAVYTFMLSGATWTQFDKLFPSAGPTSIQLGWAVDMDGTTLVASENSDVSGAAHPSAVHMWQRQLAGTWLEQPTLQPADIAVDDAFGAALDLTSDHLFVGAPLQDSQGFQNVGAIYMYEMHSAAWSLAGKLLSVDAAHQMRFGDSVSTEGFHVLAGAPNWNNGNGAAWMYRIIGPLVGVPYCAGDSSAGICPCANFSSQIPRAGCRNSSGQGARLYATGSAHVSASDLTCVCESLVIGRPSVLVGGLSSPGHGVGRMFGDGLLCLGGPRVAYWPVWADGSASALWSGLYGNPYGWVEGQTWHFQVWYRDDSQSVCGTGVNLSNALEVDLLP